MGMILRIASSRIVGQGDIVGRSGYFSLNLSANSVMRGRLDARRTLKSLVADLRIKDCIHDVFVKIHMNRAKLAPTDNIAAYLTVALKNTLFNALKKTTDSFPFDEIGEREETVDESPSTPETIYINNEQKKQVQATVHTMMSVLTDRQREIIYYRYIKEMSIDEISKVTDMNNQSVSNSIQRALGRIRDLFKRK